MLLKSLNAQTIKIICVLSYNPTLGDSVIVSRLINLVVTKFPEIKIIILCPGSVKSVFSYFAPQARIFTFNRNSRFILVRRFPKVERFFFRVKLIVFLTLTQILSMGKMKVLGPDWFSRVEFQRVHSSLKWLLFKRKSTARLIDQSMTYYEFNFRQLLKADLVHDSEKLLPIGKGDAKFQLVKKNQESFQVCIVSGAGCSERDLVSLLLPEIIEVMDELRLVHFILDGNDGSLSLYQKFELIQTSSLIICNDTGWYHVADAFKIPIICLSPRAADSYDGYIQSTESKLIIRTPKILPPTNGLEEAKNGLKNEISLCVKRLLQTRLS